MLVFRGLDILCSTRVAPITPSSIPSIITSLSLMLSGLKTMYRFFLVHLWRYAKRYPTPGTNCLIWWMPEVVQYFHLGISLSGKVRLSSQFYKPPSPSSSRIDSAWSMRSWIPSFIFLPSIQQASVDSRLGCVVSSIFLKSSRYAFALISACSTADMTPFRPYNSSSLDPDPFSNSLPISSVTKPWFPSTSARIELASMEV